MPTAVVAMTSTDGVTWTASEIPGEVVWESVTYGGGLFVAVGRDGTSGIVTSIDGVTWTTSTEPEKNAWSSVVYDGNCFVAVASGGTNRVMRSCE